MYSHHTKDKGDQGLGFIIADLLRHGVQVALPISEHLPFDLIAISKDGLLSRVSVKYRKAAKGKIEVVMRSVWENRRGMHIKPVSRGTIDGLAIYCPDSGGCYYVSGQEALSKAVTLRLDPPASGRKINRWASSYQDPSCLFEDMLG